MTMVLLFTNLTPIVGQALLGFQPLLSQLARNTPGTEASHISFDRGPNQAIHPLDGQPRNS